MDDLKTQHVADMMKGNLLTNIGHRALINGDHMEATLDFLTRFANLVRADQRAAIAQAAPSEAVEKLLAAHAEAVIAAHEYGKTGGYYNALLAAEQAISAAIAAPSGQADESIVTIGVES